MSLVDYGWRSGTFTFVPGDLYPRIARVYDSGRPTGWPAIEVELLNAGGFESVSIRFKERGADRYGGQVVVPLGVWKRIADWVDEVLLHEAGERQALAREAEPDPFTRFD